MHYFDLFIVRGYYYNGEFYANTTHTEKYVGYNHKLYVDITENSNPLVYTFDGEKYTPISYIPEIASADKPGIMKLFDNSGEAIDGTMTQRSITKGIQSIKFATDALDSECLILDLPWD